MQITSLTPLDSSASRAEIKPGTCVSEQAGVKGPFGRVSIYGFFFVFLKLYLE